MNKRFLIFLSHPSQYLFLRKTITKLKSLGHDVLILIKTKDVLEDLLKNDKIDNYKNILTRSRGKSVFSIFVSFLFRWIKIFPMAIKYKPDIMIGSDAVIAQIGFFLNIQRITTLEDDYEVIKPLAWMTYPFTQLILCPKVCNVGRWERKKLGYNGYMKLGYLHPNVFRHNNGVIFDYKLPKNYVLIRLSGLAAYHDRDAKGMSEKVLNKIIKLLNLKSIKFFISSEKPIHERYNRHLLKINPSDMHDVLFRSCLLISDSQSMSVEAAILGVPSIRYSSFSGKISVLEELEKKYNLTFGIKPNGGGELLKMMLKFLESKNIKKIWKEKSEKMLKDKICVTEFLVGFLHEYPESAKKMGKNVVIKNGAIK